MIDEEIGRKIKEFRKWYGVSQIELAERIGISFQQIQKYEKGQTRISVMRLEQIAGALKIPITAFFEDESLTNLSDVSRKYMPEKVSLPGHEPFSPEELTLVRLFRKTTNKKFREGILKLLQGIFEIEHKRREEAKGSQQTSESES